MRTFRHLPYILNINFLANINHHQHSSTTLPLLPFIWANHLDIVSTNWKDSPKSKGQLPCRWWWWEGPGASFTASTPTFWAKVIDVDTLGAPAAMMATGPFLRQQFGFFWQAFFFVWASRRLTGQEVWGAIGALLLSSFICIWIGGKDQLPKSLKPPATQQNWPVIVV